MIVTSDKEALPQSIPSNLPVGQEIPETPLETGSQALYRGGESEYSYCYDCSIRFHNEYTISETQEDMSTRIRDQNAEGYVRKGTQIKEMSNHCCSTPCTSSVRRARLFIGSKKA